MKDKSENHRYKLAVFDLDGTLTRERSIWEYIHKRLGKWYGFAEEYQKRFLAGEISYEEFCDLDARVWKGMSLDELLAIARTVPFHPGAAELIAYLKGKGLKLALVSAGLTVLSDWVHERFGFDFSVSNHLHHENGVMTGQVKIDVYNDRKAVWVRRIMDRFGAAAEETLAVGDSRGDLEMFRTVGFPVAFNSSCPELDQSARVCVDSGNLADLIPKLLL